MNEVARLLEAVAALTAATASLAAACKEQDEILDRLEARLGIAPPRPRLQLVTSDSDTSGEADANA
jgi:hypothetical protein